ncbi:MAG: DEAD/DEAH box helicase [Chloroherpetonaceae bacterium]
MANNLSTNFINQVLEITQNAELTNNEKFLDIILLFEYLMNSKAEESNQIFSSYFSKWIYVFDLYKIENTYLNLLLHFRKRKKAIANKSKDLSSTDFQQFLKSVLISAARITNQQIPSELEEYIKDVQIVNPKPDNEQNISQLQGVLLKKVQNNNGFLLNCINEQIGQFNVKCGVDFQKTINYLWRNATVGFVNLNLIDSQKNLYELSDQGMIIIEPDYMFDVTDIAECYNYYGFDLLTYFSKIIMPQESNRYLIKGMIVNSLFDELIINPNIDFHTAFAKSIHQKPLKILEYLDEQFFENLIFEMELHYENLKHSIADLPKGIYSIEPTFVSPKFGLQGRLDLFIEQMNDNRKDVIELKSGGFPKSPLQIQDGDGKSFILNVWQNHYAQANCYNLLLDSVYGIRNGSSAILYSSDFAAHPRNVPNLQSFKKEIVDFRNNLFAFHRKIINGDISIFDVFSSYDLKNQFQRDGMKEILEAYDSLDEIEKEYVDRYFQFIFKEELISKIGNNSRRDGYASFWRESMEYKKDNFSIITQLDLDIDESNFDEQHLIFHKEDCEELSFLRIGDPIFLYPENIGNPTEHYILKGYLRNINNESIEISLMNKALNSQYLLNNTNWIIEIDNSDSLTKKQFANISEFILASSQRRNLLLGRIEPTIEENININLNINDNYIKSIIAKSISAKDYFLIQGPPGTGKTSIIIKHLAQYYWEHTNLNILFLAYTNRAVDEICAVLSNEENHIPFIKIASKEAVNYREYTLAQLSSKYTLQALKQNVQSNRFYVSTISSLQTNPEIFSLKKFDLVIIDEASQVLEPQIIGILTKMPKFIMIGDEKQLPAVIQQEQEEINDENFKLSEIGISKIGTSIFSRLLQNAKQKGWDNCYMMLKKQARMHKDIQDLANHLFYKNSLEIREEFDWQTERESQYYKTANSDFLRNIFSSRIAFINSSKEFNSKRNISEAKFIKYFIQSIFQEETAILNAKSLGIISPFRLQCAEIIQSMPQIARDTISVDTVERFQGSERDIIIVSYAVNFDYEREMASNIELIDDVLVDRKLNVAITRAREHLIIIGCEEILAKSPIQRKLINYIKENGLYFDLSELQIV